MDSRAYGKGSQKLAGGESLAMEVSKIPNGIGYCGLAYADAKGVRAVDIDGVRPTVKNVSKYPISRDLFFYTVGNPPPEVRQFIQWVRDSKEARDIIDQNGFIPCQRGPSQ